MKQTCIIVDAVQRFQVPETIVDFQKTTYNSITVISTVILECAY